MNIQSKTRGFLNRPLAGKVALVTGSTSGIGHGRRLDRALKREGNRFKRLTKLRESTGSEWSVT
jgi:NADP-dependent 3-hydroxy acid dehydrogenase YdfG